MKEPWAYKLLTESRQAHLATSTKDGKPHVVPICYVYTGDAIYTPIDEKPKRAKPRRLRRVLNILQNAKVSLVMDHYSEDWRNLRYVIVRGLAEIVRADEEQKLAVSLLRDKYNQYRSMRLESRPIIKVTPVTVIAWRSSGL